MDKKECFRLTREGRSIWRARSTVPLPIDYRRILGLVDYAGYAEVIHSRLARLPAEAVDALLAEFQEMRLIEPVEAAEPDLATLARRIKPPPVEPEDHEAYEDLSAYVDTSLSRLGVYVASDRVRRRSPCEKAPHDTAVLIVEDDPDQRALAARRLSAAGYPARTVDGVQALYKFLGRNTPDAIFLDVNMPDGDGFDVLTVLRRHPRFTFVPIVMLTVRSAANDVLRGLELGADGYVTKGYRRNTLDYVLRYVLQQEVPVTTATPARLLGQET